MEGKSLDLSTLLGSLQNLLNQIDMQTLESIKAANDKAQLQNLLSDTLNTATKTLNPEEQKAVATYLQSLLNITQGK